MLNSNLRLLIPYKMNYSCCFRRGLEWPIFTSCRLYANCKIQILGRLNDEVTWQEKFSADTLSTSIEDNFGMFIFDSDHPIALHHPHGKS